MLDGEFILHKFEIQDEKIEALLTIDLNRFSFMNQDKMKEIVCGNDFTRISVTDRCLTIKGVSMNLHTGQYWDFMAN